MPIEEYGSEMGVTRMFRLAQYSDEPIPHAHATIIGEVVKRVAVTLGCLQKEKFLIRTGEEGIRIPPR